MATTPAQARVQRVMRLAVEAEYVPGAWRAEAARQLHLLAAELDLTRRPARTTYDDVVQLLQDHEREGRDGQIAYEIGVRVAEIVAAVRAPVLRQVAAYEGAFRAGLAQHRQALDLLLQEGLL